MGIKKGKSRAKAGPKELALRQMRPAVAFAEEAAQIVEIASAPVVANDDLQEAADQIRAAFTSAVAGFVEAGRLLCEWKEKCKHGEWERLFAGGEGAVERPVPFSVQTALKLMAVASHKWIANPAHVRDLPPHWGTLYELTQARIPLLETALEQGLIRSEMSRAEAIALKVDQKIERAAKENRREFARQKNVEKIARAEEATDDAPAPDPLSVKGEFSTIVVDPPWDWGDERDADQLGRARPTYATMPIADLLVFPLVPRAAADDCHLYLWVTNRSLPKGFALIEAWGFRYVTCLTWCKPSIGMGNYFRGSSEQVLFAVRGSLPLRRKDVGTWFAAPRAGQHSAKPDDFYALVESCSPGPYLDVFARKPRLGWSVWGAEVERP